MLNSLPNNLFRLESMQPASNADNLEEEVSLRSGKTAYCRPIQAGDERLIEEFYACLSPKSQRARFNTTLSSFAPTFLAQMSSQTVISATQNGAGFIVFVDEWSRLNGMRPIAIGYFVKTLKGEAELALAVDDQYQKQGLGTMLMRRLIDEAPAQNVSALGAYVDPHNDGMTTLIHHTGLFADVQYDGGMLNYQLYIKANRLFC